MATPILNHVTSQQLPWYGATPRSRGGYYVSLEDSEYKPRRRSVAWLYVRSSNVPIIIMALALVLITIFASIVSVYGRPKPADPSKQPATGWELDKLTSLVTFGDSYTDEARAWYMNDHGGSGPPPGWVGPVNAHTYTGGYVWPRYVNWYSGANTYNYAVSGAVCSRTITAHKGVGIQEYEIPAFLADKAIVTGGQPFLLTPVNETVYSIWIGTNDLGWNAFLTHEEEPGKTLNDYVDCVFKTFDQIYAAGGRYLVLMNNIPLQLAPMYADAAHGGLNWTHFWPERPTNTTLVSQQIESNVQTANSLFKSKLEAISKEGTRYAAAQVALFDTYQLFQTIYNNPRKYLNGTATPDVTKPVVRCSRDGGCATDSSPDSFVWWDDLHPSEQSDRTVAREFLKVAAGTSSFATYYSG